MSATQKNREIFFILILLVGLFIFAQISFFIANLLTSETFETAHVLVLTYSMKAILSSKVILIPIIYFVLSQVLMYVTLIALLWYVTVSVSELCKCTYKQSRMLALLISLVSICAILITNCYYFHSSFFTQLIQKNLFHNLFTHSDIKKAFVFIMVVLSMLIALTFIHIIHSFVKKQNILRNGIALILIVSVCAIAIFKKHGHSVIAHKNDKPNIIIIGFDALRPDFVGINNAYQTHSPHINNFLNTSIVFENTYTPMSRTSPSWTTILTGQHPKHHQVRDNNFDIRQFNLPDTLAKRLQQNGYQTYYLTDDRRFNIVDQSFGFDVVMGSSAEMNDFLLGSANDFPLSNIISFTYFGKWLFPYTYGNHGSDVTYNPNHFLRLIENTQQKRDINKPLFLAVHFNISGWPFNWYNNDFSNEEDIFYKYKNGVAALDDQYAQFYHLLQTNHILDHAIVILLSDHGIALGLPGDRIISKNKYKGDASNIRKIKISQYHQASKFDMDFVHHYGIDTAFGYAIDVLSLKQQAALLAIKGFGVDVGAAHKVSGVALMQDIMPTILDLLHLPMSTQVDGFSLKKYLFNSDASISNNRPVFLESGFSPGEIEHPDIKIDKVLNKVIGHFDFNPDSGSVFLKHNFQKVLLKTKQHAVMQNEWLLAHYPVSKRLIFVHNKHDPKRLAVSSVTIPDYMILVNLRNGHWTMELDSEFAKQAPLRSLKQQLRGFYNE